jgi:uncharacterized membrane protein
VRNIDDRPNICMDPSTSHVSHSMDFIKSKEYFSLTIGTCSTGFDVQDDGFADETWFGVFTVFVCAFVPSGTGLAITILIGLFPAIKHSSRYRFFSLYDGIFIGMLSSSIFNQMVSAFATRPLSMSIDLRFMSMLGIQWIGFGLCLITAFICGVKYAVQYAQSKKEGLE